MLPHPSSSADVRQGTAKHLEIQTIPVVHVLTSSGSSGSSDGTGRGMARWLRLTAEPGRRNVELAFEGTVEGGS